VAARSEGEDVSGVCVRVGLVVGLACICSVSASAMAAEGSPFGLASFSLQTTRTTEVAPGPGVPGYGFVNEPYVFTQAAGHPYALTSEVQFASEEVGESHTVVATRDSSTFRTVPDVPVGTFELTLPQGKYPALAAPDGKLCQDKLTMPTAFTAQNGATIKQNTPIEVEGCPNALQVLRRRVHKQAVSLTVSVPQAGRLTATAKGLTPAAKSPTTHQTVTLTLYERHTGKLHTKIQLRFTPNKGKQRKALRKSITVTLG
jgi:hypothetical protein